MFRLLNLTCCVILSASLLAQVPKGAEENAALRYWNAFAQMTDQKLSDEQSKQLANIASGKAPWDEAAFGKLLDENQEAVGTMVRGTALPYCAWGVDYQLAEVAPIPQIGRGRALARLNLLTAQRLAARGKSREATYHLIAGVRFARDLGAGMPLIGVLVGKMALTNDVDTAVELAHAQKLSAEDQKRFVAAVKALPEDVFDWGGALKLESDSILSTLKRLQTMPDPAKLLESWGMHEAAKDPRPSDEDIRQTRGTLLEVEKLFRQPIAVNQEGVARLQERLNKLKPVASGMIPLLQKQFDSRREVVELRKKVVEGELGR